MGILDSMPPEAQRALREVLRQFEDQHSEIIQETRAAIEAADPDRKIPMTTWVRYVLDDDGQRYDRRKAMAWTGVYSPALQVRVAEMALGFLDRNPGAGVPETAAHVLSTLVDEWTFKSGPDGLSQRGCAAPNILTHFVLRIMIEASEAMLAGGAPGTDCGDPTCPGHETERREGQPSDHPGVPVVMPPTGRPDRAGAMTVFRPASSSSGDDDPLTGLYL